MKLLTITPTTLVGEVNSIASKSISHRLMIAASLANGTSYIENVLESQDLTATIEILKNLGISINKIKNKNKYIVKGNTFNNLSKILDAKESGSTLRFFIPITWNIPGEHEFTGNNILASRPLSVYEDIAKAFNYQLTINDNKFPIKTKGPIRPGNYYIDGSVSSQFVTGLLLVLPLLNDNSKIIFTKEVASKGYIDLTLDVLKQSGINITKIKQGFEIKGNQKYQTLDKVVEGDYSQAVFFLIAGLINKSVSVNNLNINSLQGDKEIINIIKNANGKITISNSTVTTYRSDLIASTIDLYDIPDLGPILMVMASVSKGVTTFLNVDRLTTKESNRLLAMKDNLTKMGVSFTIDNNIAYIKGIDQLKGGFVAKTYNDHRIAMAMTIASSIATKPVILDDYTVVNKSYPIFFKDYCAIGGIVNETK